MKKNSIIFLLAATITMQVVCMQQKEYKRYASFLLSDKLNKNQFALFQAIYEKNSLWIKRYINDTQTKYKLEEPYFSIGSLWLLKKVHTVKIDERNIEKPILHAIENSFNKIKLCKTPKILFWSSLAGILTVYSYYKFPQIKAELFQHWPIYRIIR